MSKIKINTKVVVKATHKEGIVKGRDIRDLGNGRVKVEYIVKTGDHFEDWNTYSKDELQKLSDAGEEKWMPTLVVEADNGYKVTLAGIVTNKSVVKDSFDEDGYYTPYLRKGKELKIGYSICNPNDTFDITVGERIAIHRAKKKPFCNLVSDFNGEFNNETVVALLRVKGEYIVEHIDKFIRTDKN